MEQIFRALSDPTRLAVVETLARGDQAVGQLAAPFKMSLPSFMQHLKILEDASLITTRKSGRVRTCRLQVQTMKSAESWLNAQRQLWTTRLDQLDNYLTDLADQHP